MVQEFLKFMHGLSTIYISHELFSTSPIGVYLEDCQLKQHFNLIHRQTSERSVAEVKMENPCVL